MKLHWVKGDYDASLRAVKLAIARGEARAVVGKAAKEVRETNPPRGGAEGAK